MKLYSLIGLENNDIVSIVGAGGKTSFMFQLAKELRCKNVKTLVTTTTKIYLPKKDEYDFICISQDDSYNPKDKDGIHVYGAEVNLENKVIGLNEKQLQKLVPNFDYTIIEADGSKRKGIKGWNDHEPVIYNKTTKTIGVLNIQALGITICEENVHRSDEFCKITNSNLGESITFNHLLNLVLSPKGLFKNAKGERILFINKADNAEYVNMAKQLKDIINSTDSKFLSKIIIGSLKNNSFL